LQVDVEMQIPSVRYWPVAVPLHWPLRVRSSMGLATATAAGPATAASGRRLVRRTENNIVVDFGNLTGVENKKLVS